MMAGDDEEVLDLNWWDYRGTKKTGSHCMIPFCHPSRHLFSLRHYLAFLHGLSQIYSTCHHEPNWWTGVFGWGYLFLCEKCSQCHPSESFRNICLRKARGRWPNSSAARTPNKQSSRYQMSPGCDSPLQPGNTWSVSGNALPSCQACCFNGLISETIIVNTSQRTCLQDSGEMAWSRWVMTTKSESRRPSLTKWRNTGDRVLNETVW